MFEPRRQHPVAAITKVLEIIRGNFITIIVILFVGGSGDDETLFNLTWLFGTIIVLLIWGILSWMRFTYRIEEDQLVIEQGVLMRKNIYISKDRIQMIDITSGIVQRLFGLVEVQVKTAGSSSKEAKISAVTKEVARKLREELRKDGVETDTEAEPHVETPYQSFRLSPKDLVVAASTSGRFGVALSIVGTVFSQIDQVVSSEAMFRYLERVIPTSASMNLVLTSIVFVLVISWILSFIGTLITYGNFAVHLKEDELVIAHGIFEQKQLTVPYNRVQAIQIKEELLRQPFGYVSLKLDSAGYGDEGGKSVMLFPLMPKEKVSGFIEQVLPEYADRVDAVQPPGKSLRRYIVRMVLAASFIASGVWLLLPLGYYPFLLFLPAIYLGYMQYRDAAIGINKETMVLRYRLLSCNTVILKRYRVQTVERSANPFQTRQGLADFTVTVASGSQGHEFTVRDLVSEQVDRFWNWPSFHASFQLDVGPVTEDEEKDQDPAVMTLPGF